MTEPLPEAYTFVIDTKDLAETVRQFTTDEADVERIVQEVRRKLHDTPFNARVVDLYQRLITEIVVEVCL